MIQSTPTLKGENMVQVRKKRSEQTMIFSFVIEKDLLKKFKAKSESLDVKHAEVLRSMIRSFCSDEIDINFVK